MSQVLTAAKDTAASLLDELAVIDGMVRETDGRRESWFSLSTRPGFVRVEFPDDVDVAVVNAVIEAHTP
jgi:hypothetical protein